MAELGNNLVSLLIFGMAFLLFLGIATAVLLLVYGLFFRKSK
jgi:hypothetical protein